MSNGIIYTETLVHSAPEQFVAEAPYQLVIVTLDSGGRTTARIAGPDKVVTGDAVTYVEHRHGTPFFKKL